MILKRIKNWIHETFERGQYFEIYKKHFYAAKVKYGDNRKEKELGSFYSKLLSTLGPDKFTALDQPIKDYFGLGKESFIVAYSIINDCYLDTVAEKKNVIAEIRQRWKVQNTKNELDIDKICDLKLIALIMWSKANKGK
ncbi:MAG TPA: hypothetical protein VMF29_02310 [Candidatus Edwardsbacteria bacterium]|nr:hypothetical protein [Candidatus Edwardsbacteria bacterium]